MVSAGSGKTGSAAMGVIAFLGLTAAVGLGLFAYIEHTRATRLRKTVDEARSGSEKMGENYQKLKQERERLNTQLANAKVDLHKERLTVESLRDQVREKEDELNRKIEELETLKASFSTGDRERADLERTLQAKDLELGNLKAALAKMRGDLEAAQKEIRSGEAKVKQLEKEKEEALGRAAAARASERRAKSLAQQKQYEAEQKAIKLEGDLARKDEQLKGIGKTLQGMMDERKKLLTELDSLKKATPSGKREIVRFGEELRFSAGACGAIGDVKLRVSDATMVGSKISLSHVLDMDLDNVGFFADFLGAGRFGFSFNAFYVKYTGETTLAEEVRFAGITAESGNDVEATLATTQVSAAIRINLFDVFRTDRNKLTFGMLLGARYMSYSMQLDDVTDSETAKDSLYMVIPLTGLHLSYRVGPDIGIYAKVFGAAARFQEYSMPNFMEGSVSAVIRLTRFVSLEIGYLYSNLHARYENEDTTESFRAEHVREGPYAGLVAVF